MRLGIDIRCLLTPYRTGVGEYAAGLIAALAALDRANEYFLFYNCAGKPLARRLRLPAAMRLVAGRYPNKFLNSLIAATGIPHLDHLVERRLRRAGDAGGPLQGWFSPNLNFTSLRADLPWFQTIHDLSFEFFPEFFSPAQRAWHRAVRPRQSCTKARLIFTPSASTKRDVCARYGIGEERVVVLPPGIPQQGLPNPAAREQAQKKFRLAEEPYLLFVGTLEPRKNVLGLIAAFEEYCRAAGMAQACRLVIAGAPGYQSRAVWRRAAASPVCKKISFTGYVTAEEKDALYRSAAVFVFPSFYEGFGFPVLEAMAAGVPVLTSNRTSLPEITGGGAYLANPHRPAEIAEGIWRLLTDGTLRERLRAAALERTGDFTFPAMAAGWLTAVQGALGR